MYRWLLFWWLMKACIGSKVTASKKTHIGVTIIGTISVKVVFTQYQINQSKIIWMISQMYNKSWLLTVVNNNGIE